MKLLGRRITASILAIIMIVSSLQFSADSVYAKEAAEGTSYAAALAKEAEDGNEAEYIAEAAKDGSASETDAVDSETGDLKQPDASTEDSEQIGTEKPDASAEDLEESGMGNPDDEVKDSVITPEEEEAQVLESAAETELQLEIVKTELEGVYQFGGAPSEEALESDEPSFSVESDGEAAEVYEVDGVTVEEYIYQELLKRSIQIDIYGYNISTGNVGSIFSGVLNEHPDLYFVNKGISWSLTSDGIVTVLKPTYSNNVFDDDAFKSETKTALATVKAGMSDLQKAVVLHDYLAVNCEYDYENYLAEMNKTGSIPSTSYSAYGVLVSRTAVCQGYALAYKYLLNQVDIECYMVNSVAMNHAWNLIKLDGKYYQVDVTWDDPTWDMIGRVGHNYMFCSDEVFEDANHNHRDWEVTSGSDVVSYKATDTKYDNAFWSNVSSPLVLTGDSWDDCYYACYDDAAYISKIKKTKLSDVSNVGTGICDIGKWAVWGKENYYYKRACTGLFQYNNRLYYNDITFIYSIAFDGSDKRVEFEADTTNGYIYGSALCQGKVLYSLHKSLDMMGKETVLIAPIEIKNDEPAVPVESITLSPDTLTLLEGATAKLTATVTPADATDPTVTWESSNPSVATVEGGVVTAAAEGSCTITATAGDKTAACAVTVTKKNVEPPVIAVESITIDKSTLELEAGTTAKLTATVTPADATDPTVTWESSNPSVAAVADGVVTAAAEGSCTITATAGDKTAACAVTVTKKNVEPPVIAVESITIDKSTLELEAGTTAKLTATVTPADATNPTVTWESSDSSVAAVADGVVTAVAEGSCTITATAGSKSAVCNIVVTAAKKDDEENVNKDGFKVALKEPNKQYIYTGSAVKPEIIVTNNGISLKEGIDYTVKYTNNIKVSEHAKITVTGKGNLSGSKTKEFPIIVKELDNRDIKSDDVTSPKVEGDYATVVEGAKVSPVLMYNGKKLTTKDYKFADDNYKTYKWEAKDDGTPITVMAQENGNFTGSRTLRVRVIPKAEQSKYKLSVKLVNDPTKLTYDGQPKKASDLGLVTASTKDMPSGLVEAKGGQTGDYIIYYPSDITSAGSKKITVVGISDRCIGTVTKSYTIKPKKAELTLEFDKAKKGYTFVSTGTTVTDLVVKDGSTKLEAGKDYKVSYSGNKKAGSAKVIVSGIGNYKGCKKTETFTINPAVLSNNTANGAAATQGLKIVVADKVFKKPGVYKSTPYVSINGVLLKASNYDVAYYLDNPATNPNARLMDNKDNKVTNENGDTTVWVKITGKKNGNYATEDNNCYAIKSYKVRSKVSENSYDLAKAKVTFKDKDGNIIKKVNYTGNPITGDDITVVVTYKIDGQDVTLNKDEHYNIEFVNNVNKGKATVVINGTGTPNQYIGSKTATFSIAANNVKNIAKWFN